VENKLYGVEIKRIKFWQSSIVLMTCASKRSVVSEMTVNQLILRLSHTICSKCLTTKKFERLTISLQMYFQFYTIKLKGKSLKLTFQAIFAFYSNTRN